LTPSPAIPSTAPSHPLLLFPRPRLGLITFAPEAEVIAADTTIQADDLVYIADTYGRVTSIRNGTVGTMYYCVGRAKYPSTAINQRIRISVTLQQVKL